MDSPAAIAAAIAATNAATNAAYNAADNAQCDMSVDIPVALPADGAVLYADDAPSIITESFLTTHMCIRCDQLIEIRIPLFMEKSYRMECPFCKYQFYFGAHKTSSCIGPCTIL
jgi:hypothetical protein